MNSLREMGLRWLLVAIAVVAVAGVAAACSGDDDSSNATEGPSVVVGDNSEPAFYGAMISPPPAKPDLVLTDASGQPYDIQKETEGQVTLLYLGYTNCPDVCPTFMSDLASVMKQLDPAVAEKVTVLFVTTDPERDTPEVIGQWLSHFDKDFVGLTGDPQALVSLQQAMGMQPATKDAPDEHGDYGVSHGSYVLAFTPKDNVAHLVYPAGISRADWMHDLNKLVTEGWTEG